MVMLLTMWKPTGSGNQMDTTGLSKDQLRSYRLAKKLIKDANGDQVWLKEMLDRQDCESGVVGWVLDLQGEQLAKAREISEPEMSMDKRVSEFEASLLEMPKVDLSKIRDDFWNGKDDEVPTEPPVQSKADVITPKPLQEPRSIIVTFTTAVATARFEIPC